MSVATHKSAQAQRSMTLQQAIDEAQRCLLCHDAPCSTGCPGGTDPAKFIRQIRFYNLKGAARTVLRNNPLGGVCAYVCPSSDTCERTCTRQQLDRPIDIDGLQAFAVEYGRQHGVSALEPGQKRNQRVAVIGAGPAGLTAAARLAMYGYRVTVFEARDQAGGMLRYGVPTSRLNNAQLDADLADILALGVELRTQAPVHGEQAIQKLFDGGYAAVFVAPGLWKAAQLTLPGIDADGVSTALHFLAACRSDVDTARALVADKNVAIIGGGSVAMDVARSARELGARRIYAIALEGMRELPAQRDELEQAFADDVIIKPQCQLTRILCENNKVIGVEGHEIEWLEAGKLVPSNARGLDGTEFQIRVAAVIQAIGQRVDDRVGQIFAQAKNPQALIDADAESQKTDVDKVFAGGDIVRGAGTVVAAVGDGKRAADAIHKMLSQGTEVAQ